jgi:predicted RNA-binding protein with PUA-like domain
MAKIRHWLLKSEPDAYSIDDLASDGTTYWDGVRNYQARNFMRDDMKVGDLVLYYHSNTKPPGVVGLARVSGESYIDPTQFDLEDKHFDAKSDPKNPRWLMVDVEFVAKFAKRVSLDELKAAPALDEMLVTRRGQRLSVQPVEAVHFRHVLKMAGHKL